MRVRAAGSRTRGFQLVKAFVSVRRDGVENAGIGRGQGSSIHPCWPPFAIQEQPSSSTSKTKVLRMAQASLWAQPFVPSKACLNSLNYSTVLSTIRAAGNTQALFHAALRSQSVAGEAYCNPDTITLEYREATPHSQAAVDRLCEMSAQLA